jgi:hypothetical protein
VPGGNLPRDFCRHWILLRWWWLIWWYKISLWGECHRILLLPELFFKLFWKLTSWQYVCQMTRKMRVDPAQISWEK